MYELLVLVLLMHWPLHAYRLAKIANEIIGPEERISTGTLSTLLNKLEQAGLIRAADPGSVPFPSDRPSRAVEITSQGRDRFVELMVDTTSHQGLYRRIIHIKALGLEFLSPEQQIFLLEHYVAHCRQILHAKQVETRADAENPLKRQLMSPALREAAFAFMRLKIQQWQLELAWAEALRDKIVTHLKAEGNSRNTS